jgi:hypothetical protein
MAIIAGHQEVYSALAGKHADRAEARMRADVTEHERYAERRFLHQLHRIAPWETFPTSVAS